MQICITFKSGIVFNSSKKKLEQTFKHTVQYIQIYKDIHL